jgi:hypothetical protein
MYRSTRIRFFGCPTISDRTDSTALLDRDEILTTEPSVTIVFNYGLPNVTLHSDHGFNPGNRAPHLQEVSGDPLHP